MPARANKFVQTGNNASCSLKLRIGSCVGRMHASTLSFGYTTDACMSPARSAGPQIHTLCCFTHAFELKATLCHTHPTEGYGTAISAETLSHAHSSI